MTILFTYLFACLLLMSTSFVGSDDTPCTRKRSQKSIVGGPIKRQPLLNYHYIILKTANKSDFFKSNLSEREVSQYYQLVLNIRYVI